MSINKPRGKPSVLLLADSRGRQLLYPIKRAVKEILMGRKSHYNLVLLFAGVNNLTTTNHDSVSFAFSEMPETVDGLTDELTIAKYFLKNFADNIILCHLIGLDLLAYNNHLNKHQRAATSIQQPTNDDQSLINDTCVTLNQTITLINGDDNLQSPFLQDTIHCLVKGKRVHKYIRFRDGLHPDDRTVQLWAQVFAKGISRNLTNLGLI